MRERMIVRQTTSDSYKQIWAPGYFRLFISHSSADKAVATDLVLPLHRLGVDAFVAHQSIRPTLRWQAVIQQALRSMHAIVAILTPRFRRSKWTDQEVGFALARRVRILSIRMGSDPHGFLGRDQALTPRVQGDERLLDEDVIDALWEVPSLRQRLTSGFVSGLQHANSPKAAMPVFDRLEKASQISAADMNRIESCSNRTAAYSASLLYHRRLKRLIARHAR